MSARVALPWLLGPLARVVGRAPLVVVGLVVVALLLTGLLALRGGDGTRTVTAYFSRAVQIYPGTDVRILGVGVGEVTAVVPEGTQVRVDMEYDDEYPVPRNAQAVIITPTLTADRFVQLTPAYTSGERMPDGGEIDMAETGTPVELDRIYRSLTDLTTALGPNGVNEDGTLDAVLGAGADLLEGRGRKANRMLTDLAEAATTFGDGSGELFATVSALNEFTTTLAENDATVSGFIQRLGGVSTQLAGERDELTAALRTLAGILGKVEGFVKGNRRLLVGEVKNLSRVLQVLVDEKDSLEAALTAGPLAMGNLTNAWDAHTQTVGSRLFINGSIQNMDDFLCTLVKNGQIPLAPAACRLFEVLLSPVFEGNGGLLTGPFGNIPIDTRLQDGPAPRELSGRPAPTTVAGLLGGG